EQLRHDRVVGRSRPRRAGRRVGPVAAREPAEAQIDGGVARGPAQVAAPLHHLPDHRSPPPPSGRSVGVSAPIRRAGLPATIVDGAPAATPTDPADTMLPRPIVTPGKTMHRRPIQTLSSIVTGRTSSASGGAPSARVFGSAGWPLESNMITSAAIRTRFPIVIRLATLIQKL